jgi:hypothetical protein
MDSMSARDLLEIWENGVGRAPVDQALVLLQAACPQIPVDGLAGLTIGRRDACLLDLRRRTFGPRITGLAACPACRESLELSFDVGLLQSGEVRWPTPESVLSKPIETSMSIASFDLAFRLPSSQDVRAAGEDEDPARRLLEACVVSVRKDGKAAKTADLSSEALQAVVDRMEREDPMANIALDATCPACGYRWQVIFDIVSYFWSEIQARAIRLMQEVHVLASAYGWHERDILAMSPKRRQRYLEMVGA